MVNVVIQITQGVVDIAGPAKRRDLEKKEAEGSRIKRSSEQRCVHGSQRASIHSLERGGLIHRWDETAHTEEAKVTSLPSWQNRRNGKQDLHHFYSVYRCQSEQMLCWRKNITNRSYHTALI